MPAQILAHVILIGAAATAVALAPTAAADTPGCTSGPRCSDASPSYNAPESARPGGAPTGWTNETKFINPGYNPFGSGPIPPLLALE